MPPQCFTCAVNHIAEEDRCARGNSLQWHWLLPPFKTMSDVCWFPCFSSKACENLAFSWLHVYLITVVRNYVDMKNKWSTIPKWCTNQSKQKPLVIRLPLLSFIKSPANYKILCKTKLLIRVWSIFQIFQKCPPAPHQRDRDRETQRERQRQRQRTQNFTSKPRYLANFEV